jgi:alkylation response protein AidB-like acyl-CoA dehydrogenase
MTTPVDEPTESIAEFRTRVRAFFASLPDVLAPVHGTLNRARAYRSALCAAGLAGISYPTQLGGAGLSAEHEAAFHDESLELVPGEDALFGLGLGMVVPTLRDHASDELQQRFIPPALRGDEIWCQLYSEPGAGSDLAGLTTRAVRDGDEWIITGQKVWTSQAHTADLGILIARTDFDVPKHSGITMFALPMHQPGVTVRPLVQMTGAAEFNEVFLDEARVPAEWVVGDVNGGWGLAVALLGHERTSLGRGQLTDDENKSKAGRSPLPFSGLVARATAHERLDGAVIRDDLAVAYTGERLVPWGTSRHLYPSIGKLWRTIQGRHCAQVAHVIGGASATAWEPGDTDADYWAYHVLNCRGMSLGGGTDEIQKNTIGERVLDLPREPGPDRNTPFSELPRN